VGREIDPVEAAPAENGKAIGVGNGEMVPGQIGALPEALVEIGEAALELAYGQLTSLGRLGASHSGSKPL
jgi:hypothetical protein